VLVGAIQAPALALERLATGSCPVNGAATDAPITKSLSNHRLNL
jgi:hypothetical protein